jgi:transposase InsO family protein
MRWVMTIKDHATGLTYLCALPRKRPHLVVYKLQEIFGIIGYPKIFHTDNGKEFTAKVVLKALREMNPHIYAVTSRPRCPSDQGSVETLLTERRLAGDNPNWTEVLCIVAAVINSQHGCGKDDVSSFEAVYGQVLNHDMSCSKAEAHQCWTLPQFLKVTNNAEFAEYAAKKYNLDEDSTDAAKQDDSSGYFSDKELQEDENQR